MTLSTPVHALLLAAGFGTRLRPLTFTKPKCLVEINGEPLLERWIRSLEVLGCTKTIINTHYLADQVNSYIDIRPKSRMSIECHHEENLLGTAATLMFHKDKFTNSIGLLIHADNVTSADLSHLLTAHLHRPDNCLLTMLTFDADEPSKCGILDINHDSVVVGFHEKVDNPPGCLANAAVYAFDETLFQWIDNLDANITDFSTQVIPSLLGRIFTCKTNDPFIDIGTFNNLEKARRIFSDPFV